MEKENAFAPGKTVFHKSDVSGNFPMIIASVEDDKKETREFCLSWLTKTGLPKFKIMPENVLRPGRGI